MSDLPDLSLLTSAARSTVSLVEAVGYGPDFTIEVTAVQLTGSDGHSKVTYSDLLKRTADHADSYSAERWLRLYFQPPFTAITKLRLWVPNYDPDDGWTLNWGTVNEFRKPVRSQSSIANIQVRAADPGLANIGVSPVSVGSSTLVSDWVVLQADWAAGPIGPIQTDAPVLTFGWREV
jgi:hypothetical protein